MTTTYFQMEIALVAVLGLIFLLSFFLRKRQARPGIMQLVTYQSLGPKKGVAALKINGDILILAVTPADIRLLKTVSEPGAERPRDREAVREISDRLRKLKSVKETLYAHN